MQSFAVLSNVYFNFSIFDSLLLDSDSDCKQCSSVLQELENIDDDAEVAGIPIVKLEDKLLAKTVGVFALPAIVFFRLYKQKGSKEEVIITFENNSNERYTFKGQ
jgi:hypothetical protein